MLIIDWARCSQIAELVLQSRIKSLMLTLIETLQESIDHFNENLANDLLSEIDIQLEMSKLESIIENYRVAFKRQSSDRLNVPRINALTSLLSQTIAIYKERPQAAIGTSPISSELTAQELKLMVELLNISKDKKRLHLIFNKFLKSVPDEAHKSDHRSSRVTGAASACDVTALFVQPTSPFSLPASIAYRNILKKRVLPDIARKTVEASNVGARFFLANTANGLKLMRNADAVDKVEASSVSQLST